jgi:signal transduction histidine kinase
MNPMYCYYHLQTLTRALFFFLIILFTSCNQRSLKSEVVSTENDSVYYYYKESIRSDVDANVRAANQEKAYNLFVANNIVNEQSMYTIYTQAMNYKNQKNDSGFTKAVAELLKRAKALNNTDYLTQYYQLSGSYYDEYSRDLDTAFEYYNEAKNLYLEAKDSVGVGICLLNMAIIQKNKNDYNGSEDTAVDALSYLENSDEKDNLASLYSVLGKNQRELLRYKESIENYELAIAMTTKPKNRLIYKNNLAMVLADMKSYEKAIALLTEITEDSLVQSDMKEAKARFKDNLAYTKWRQDTNLNVENELLASAELRKSIADKRGMVASYTHLAEYYLDKDTDAVLNYGKKVIDLAKDIPMPEAELDVLKFMMKAEPTAIVLRDRHIFLGDSLQEANLKVRSRFAQTKYDNIKLKQQNYENDKERQIQEKQKIINGIIAILVVIIAGFIVYYLYQKHKRERILEVYNTETRISKKVHDELANDVYNVMVVLQKVLKNKAGLTNKVLNQVEDIYVRTRNISHENDSIDTGEYYTDSLRDMIGDYNTEETAIIIKDIEYPHWEKVETYIKIVVYRALQELMVNMKKHSKATVVVLTFSTKDKKLHIHYSDNGVGLPFIKASKRDLLNMENRIQSAEGTLNFDSESGKGLKLRMIFPM